MSQIVETKIGGRIIDLHRGGVVSEPFVRIVEG